MFSKQHILKSKHQQQQNIVKVFFAAAGAELLHEMPGVPDNMADFLE